jgi:hypothetical protein
VLFIGVMQLCLVLGYTLVEMNSSVGNAVLSLLGNAGDSNVVGAEVHLHWELRISDGVVLF